MSFYRSEFFLNGEKEKIKNILKENEFVLVTDGGGDNTAQRNPVGLAFIALKNGKIIHSESMLCVDELNTSNKAEVLAVYEGVKWLKENEGAKEITLLSDSRFVTDFCANSKWAPKHTGTQKNYYPAYVMLRKEMRGIRLKPVWIPRELNTTADGLAGKKGPGVRQVYTEKVKEFEHGLWVEI